MADKHAPEPENQRGYGRTDAARQSPEGKAKSEGPADGQVVVDGEVYASEAHARANGADFNKGGYSSGVTLKDAQRGTAADKHGSDAAATGMAKGAAQESTGTAVHKTYEPGQKHNPNDPDRNND